MNCFCKCRTYDDVTDTQSVPREGAALDHQLARLIMPIDCLEKSYAARALIASNKQAPERCNTADSYFPEHLVDNKQLACYCLADDGNQ